MKKFKFIPFLVLAAIGLTMLPQQAEAQTAQQILNQRFAAIRAQLARLRPGDPRLVALATRMIQIRPQAASIATALAVRKAASIEQANLLLSVSVNTLAFARISPPIRQIAIQSASTALIQNASVNPFLVTETGDSPAVVRALTNGLVFTVESLSGSIPPEESDSLGFVVNDVLNEFVGEGGRPPGTPTPTPTPYGA